MKPIISLALSLGALTGGLNAEKKYALKDLPAARWFW